MAYTVKILDAMIAGNIINEIMLEIKKDTLSIEELIKKESIWRLKNITTNPMNIIEA